MNDISKRTENHILLLLASLNFTHILDFMIMMPLGNYLMPHFHISPQQFTFLVSAYAFSAGASSFLSAFYVNDFDRKKVLMMAYAGFLLGTLACGFAPTYHSLLVGRIVAGIFGGMIGAQVISIVADLIPYERRGKAMGMVMAAFAVSSTLGVPFSLYLAYAFSWQSPFILVAVLGLVLLPLIYKFIPNMQEHMDEKEVQEKWNVLRNIVGDKRATLALIFSGLMMMGHFMIIPFINPFLEFNMGYAKTATPLVYLCGGISSFLAANILGRIADKIGKWRTFTYCILASLPLILVITNLPKIPLVYMLIIFSLWFMAATGRGVTAQAMVSNVPNAQVRGSFQSFNSFMQQLGTGLASIIAGFVIIKNDNGILEHYNILGLLSIGIFGKLVITRINGRLARIQ